LKSLDTIDIWCFIEPEIFSETLNCDDKKLESLDAIDVWCFIEPEIFSETLNCDDKKLEALCRSRTVVLLDK
jgi:hypothetical protein